MKPEDFVVDPLDVPQHGAKAIAKIVNLRDKNGELDERRTYYALERGYYDAEKRGRIWTSTARRLLKIPRENQAS